MQTNKKFKKILRSPMTFKIILVTVIMLGTVYLYNFYLAGILLFFAIIILLFKMLGYSFILYDNLDPTIMHKQLISFMLLMIFIANLIFYIYQLETRSTIEWNPIYFKYGQYDSIEYPSKGWPSGKKDGGLIPESFTDAIGFGFSSEKGDPIYFSINMNESFEIRYLLSKTLLVGAVFEDENDNDLTGVKVFFIPRAVNVKYLNLKLTDFQWKKKEKIKHLKFNYVQLPLYEEHLIRIFFFFNLDNIVKNYYLRAI